MPDRNNENIGISKKDTAAKNKENELKSKKDEITGIMRAIPAILIAIALFLTLCFITADTGAFGKFISNVLMGLFSYMAYTIPVFISLHAIFYFADYKEEKIVKRIIFSAAALITLSMIAFLIPNLKVDPIFNLSEFYRLGTEGKGGGFIGGLLAFALMKVVGKVGLIIVILLAITVYVIYLCSGGGSELSRFFLKKIGKLANLGASLEERTQNKKKKRNEERLAKQRAFDDKKNADFYNDEYFGTDNGVSKLEIPELGILETKNSSRGTHILRETVIKSAPEEDTDSDESVSNIPHNDTKRRFNNIDVDSTPKFVRADAQSYDFRESDIVYDTVEETPESLSEDVITENTEPSYETARDFGIDDSADAIFTADFDPYDIALNERRAEKASSRASEIKEQRHGFSEFIPDMTPEQTAQKRRIEEFEENRRKALERQAAKRAEEEAARAAIERENARIAEQKTEAERLKEAERNAEADRQEEQFRLASFSSGYSGASYENRNNSYEQKSKDFGIGVKSTIEAIANDYERQFGSAVRAQSCEPGESNNFKTGDSQAYNFNEPAQESSPSPSYERAYMPNLTVRNEFTVNNITAESEANPKIDTFVKVDDPVSENFSFEKTDDEDYTQTRSNTEEFNFSSSADEEKSEELIDDFDEQDSYKTTETLEVSRTMISPEFEIEDEPEGLDFSLEQEDEEFEDDEVEEFSVEDAEELVERVEIPPEERNPDIEKYRSMFTVFHEENKDDNETDASEESAIDDEESQEESIEDEQEFSEEDSDDVPFDIPVKAVPKKEEKPKAPKPDYSNYKFPPIDLLKKSPDEDWDKINEEIQFGGEQLINTLDSFNIKATIRGMEHGPRITRYSIVPAKGVRVNQIEKLSDDIALALAAETIRIEAPIPGKSAVGVEVPNKSPSLVTLRDLLESDEFMNETSKTAVCIGKSVEGSLVYGDIGSMPHVLIAGATGMGKSVCINSLITSMLYKARPDEVKFIMIDPKKVEFAPYNGIPHLLVPVVTEPKQAAGALMWAVDEMNKRYDIIEKLCVKSIDSYNKKVADNPALGAPMPKIIIFIDELNDLMVQVRDPVENLIMLIAQKARAAGIHLVIGTQRPSVDVITGVIKANIPSRIACKVSSGIDSRTIIEQTGAEKLIGKGDMLFAPSGKAPKRVQGAFVSESETESIVDFIKAQVKGELYDETAMEDMRRAAQKCDKNKNDDGMDDDDDGGSGVGYLHDRKFLNAVELAIRNGSVATSFLQRKLHIGYGKAAQYIDIMEDLGIVGEKNGSKARDVLIRMDEWNEKLARLTDDSY